MSVFKRNKITDIPSVLYKYAVIAVLKPTESVRVEIHTSFDSLALLLRRAKKMSRKMTSITFVHCAATLLLLVAFSFLRVLRILPRTRWIVVKLMDLTSVVPLPKEMYWSSLFSWQMLKSVRNSIHLELLKTVRKDQTAPDPLLASLDGESHSRLLSFCKGSRPLVVNFCSWTCPVFRARVGEFLSVVQEFSDVADFLTIYVEEAHPSDGWAFQNNVKISTHKTLEDRCRAAKLMQDSVHFSCPIMIDTMGNEANNAYAGLPIRLYVIKNQKVKFAGLTGPTFYDPQNVAKWLKEYKVELMKTGRHRA